MLEKKRSVPCLRKLRGYTVAHKLVWPSSWVEYEVWKRCIVRWWEYAFLPTLLTVPAPPVSASDLSALRKLDVGFITFLTLSNSLKLRSVLAWITSMHINKLKKKSKRIWINKKQLLDCQVSQTLLLLNHLFPIIWLLLLYLYSD